jgi:hypothetical protein
MTQGLHSHMKLTLAVAVTAFIALLTQPVPADTPDTYCTSGVNGVCQCQGEASCKYMDKYCGGPQQCHTENGKTYCQCDKAMVKGKQFLPQRAPIQVR